MNRIYLDHVSSAPVLPEARQAMTEAMDAGGNPSSIHRAGQEARRRLEQARKAVAALIHAKPEEIFFTSCGTESNALALRGLLAAQKRKGSHVIISAIEHPSIGLTARRLELEGARVTTLPVDREGLVSPDELRAALTPETVLVSIMHANGEIGTIEPIAELARIAHETGALFHTDAVASVGHVPVDAHALGVDALSLAANLFGGPVGAAALYVRGTTRVLPLWEGGGQEQGTRSGTENLVGIVGMGAAAAACTPEKLPEWAATTARLRDRLKDGLLRALDDLRLNGSWSARLPHNLHLCVPGVSSESLVLGLDQEGVAAGIGSACNSKAMRPSHVLKAIGLSEEDAQGALLLTVGAMTTDEEIDRAIEIIPRVALQLRRVSAMTRTRA